MSADGGGVLVGGEPTALLAASTDVHEAAFRIDNVGARLVTALLPATTTIMAAHIFAPVAAAAADQALARVLASPGAGLASVGASLEALSTQLRITGQALEAAGAVGLVASGGLALLRGGRPSVLASTEGVDLRREAMGATWSTGPAGGGSSLGVRTVEAPDRSTFYVVEATMTSKQASSFGIQLNGVGAFVEGARGDEVTLRWAVPTLDDAKMLVAAAGLALAPRVGALVLPRLPQPTEAVVAKLGSASAVGGSPMVPGSTASGVVSVRSEVTQLASGGQRYAATVSGSGNVGILGITGTGGAASATVTVERNPAGAVAKVAVTGTTEVDRGRHGVPMIESGNREATLVERTVEVELMPEQRAAADRIAAAIARGEVPAKADVDLLARAGDHAKVTERTYDVRHQQHSVDIAVPELDVGGSGSVDTATLRK